jgi:hypothetical protein
MEERPQNPPPRELSPAILAQLEGPIVTYCYEVAE